MGGLIGVAHDHDDFVGQSRLPCQRTHGALDPHGRSKVGLRPRALPVGLKISSESAQLGRLNGPSDKVIDRLQKAVLDRGAGGDTEVDVRRLEAAVGVAPSEERVTNER